MRYYVFFDSPFSKRKIGPLAIYDNAKHGHNYVRFDRFEDIPNEFYYAEGKDLRQAYKDWKIVTRYKDHSMNMIMT